ncbi:MAG: hypothetical protein HYT73_04270 [Candidatus Aenigmarchaeota archaeon]|nr:hypothetical protein [Candidatus Aenigmarchaeota archaeon]
MSDSRKKAGARGKAGKREKSRIGVRFERNVDGFVLRATSGDVTGELLFDLDGAYKAASVNSVPFTYHVDGGLSHFLDKILNGKARDRLNSDPASAREYVRRLVSGCASTYPIDSGIVERLDGNVSMRYLQRAERVSPEPPAGTDEGKVYELNMGHPEPPAEPSSTTSANGNGIKTYETEDERRQASYGLGAAVYGKVDIGSRDGHEYMSQLLKRAGLEGCKDHFMRGYNEARRDASNSTAKTKSDGITRTVGLTVDEIDELFG